MPTRPLCFLLLVMLSCASVLADEPAPSPTPGGCDGFAWDMSRELTVLSGDPVAIGSGDGRADNIVRIAPETLYRTRLSPQAQVTLAAQPGKPMLDDDAFAGLLTFQVPGDGRYRVSITSGHWIDVVDAGQIVSSLDFQGRRGCPLVHKIVEFQLPAGRDLQLQFAGGAAEEVGVVITAVTPATP